MTGRHFGTLSAILPQAGLAILSALAFPHSLSAHACILEKRWVDTLPDGSITVSRCLYDGVAEKCRSAVDTRPWSEDTLLNEILSRASRRAFAALVRIDSVRSSHRDSAYQVDGVPYVDRRMKEDAYLTVVEAYRSGVEEGPLVFHEAWNMGNVLHGSEYASFFPGRGRSYLAFFDPGARLSELVRPATECDPEPGGYQLLDGRIRKTGEGAFPGLSVPLDRIVASLAASPVLRTGNGAAKAKGTAAGIADRPGRIRNPRLRDLRGRAVQGPGAQARDALGHEARGPEASEIGHAGGLGIYFDPGPEKGR